MSGPNATFFWSLGGKTGRKRPAAGVRVLGLSCAARRGPDDSCSGKRALAGQGDSQSRAGRDHYKSKKPVCCYIVRCTSQAPSSTRHLLARRATSLSRPRRAGRQAGTQGGTSAAKYLGFTDGDLPRYYYTPLCLDPRGFLSRCDMSRVPACVGGYIGIYPVHGVHRAIWPRGVSCETCGKGKKKTKKKKRKKVTRWWFSRDPGFAMDQ